HPGRAGAAGGAGAMIDAACGWLAALQAWLFERAVEPLLYRIGAMDHADMAFEAVEVALIGGLEIVVLAALLRPLEAWRPAERWADRRGVGVDMLYTVLHRVGLLPVLL